MFGVTDLGLFIISGLLLNLIPGPDSLYVVSHSAGRGFRAGSMAALGIGAGTFVHILAAAFGLSAIFATSAVAFTIVKVIGCLYLVYMGISMLLAKKNNNLSKHQVNVVTVTSFKRIFYNGFLTNSLNPKVALFFLAFVPQFIAVDSPNKAISFIVLGLIFNFNGMLWCHVLAWSSSTAIKKIKHNERIAHYLTKFTGSLFLYFGFKLAFSKQN
ncbi:LysE family translocator [uncultured Shewanella sp.]|uniref:LysE family translocator n=1 Tax=uncultured Shewanella sp. TaxID=173975 RepID=UPI0026052151|nr:LysE family translocator [uncultured Shewanella sp.]